MLIIIDYGIGNIFSIKNMLNRIGIESKLSSDWNEIAEAEKIILPGVGSYDYGMQKLNDSGVLEILNKKVIQENTPVLGICLGAQLLTESSEEGQLKGLGWIKGKTIAFDKSKLQEGQKVPHMGWSEINHFEKSKLFDGIETSPRFYFVHSYHLSLEEPNDSIATAKYGYEFSIGIEKGNILGVQFHPEKSHKYGMKVFENFIKHY